MFNDLPSIDFHCEEPAWCYEIFGSSQPPSSSFSSPYGHRPYGLNWENKISRSWQSPPNDLPQIMPSMENELNILPSDAINPGRHQSDFGQGMPQCHAQSNGLAPWASAVVLSAQISPGAFGTGGKLLNDLCSSLGGSTWSPGPSDSSIDRKSSGVGSSENLENVVSPMEEERSPIYSHNYSRPSPSFSAISLGSDRSITPAAALLEAETYSEHCTGTLGLRHNQSKRDYQCHLSDIDARSMELCREAMEVHVHAKQSVRASGTSMLTSAMVENVSPVVKHESLSDNEDDCESDYLPVSRVSARNRCRRPTKSSTHAAKRGQVSRAKVSRTKKAVERLASYTPLVHVPSSTHQIDKVGNCPHCTHTPQTRSALNKHIAIAHTRPFTCTFHLYGCSATFGSKNEWKRHVACQHLRLGIWRCDFNSCLPQQRDRDQDPQPVVGYTEEEEEQEVFYNDFNRKDLFTQHLRRMHSPLKTSPQTVRDAFNASIEPCTQRCLIDIRKPPPHSTCGYCGVDVKGKFHTTFAGLDAWEKRMEHVGRHLESGHGDTRIWKEDLELRKWLAQEGIIEESGRGTWELVGLRVQEGKFNKRTIKS